MKTKILYSKQYTVVCWRIRHLFVSSRFVIKKVKKLKNLVLAQWRTPWAAELSTEAVTKADELRKTESWNDFLVDTIYDIGL